jgi:hypothetical protein
VRTSDSGKWYRIWRRRYQNIELPSFGSVDGCSCLESNLRFSCYRISSKYVYVVTTDCHLDRDNHAEDFIYTSTYNICIIQLARRQNKVSPCCSESCLSMWLVISWTAFQFLCVTWRWGEWTSCGIVRSAEPVGVSCLSSICLQLHNCMGSIRDYAVLYPAVEFFMFHNSLTLIFRPEIVIRISSFIFPLVITVRKETPKKT